ncbi:serine/threonine-protein kinase Nek10-like isoform X3 [Mizuhopecten yessoensis]|uniref:serine/threonine-protein kinase Nek10-like isoform X3 n=1 Tax=Mizuhopecten yessoensis TaxID=6573 RepID=UPI000B4583E6|nr:serine/threonine-protein kinase Nek10-like isoform X3 [Mizuhopecten yessoensis]
MKDLNFSVDTFQSFHKIRESKNLSQLLQLINTPASKQQLPSLELKPCQSEKYLPWPLPHPKSGAHQRKSSEAVAMEKFSHKYQSERNFYKHTQHKWFSSLFSALVKQRLCCPTWIGHAPPENILLLVTCLRILMRDYAYHQQFFDLGGLKVLAEHFRKAADSYLMDDRSPYVVDILKEMTNIFQKLSTVESQRAWLIEYDAHAALVMLLHATDVVVLHCSLHALYGLAKSDGPRKMIGESNSIEQLLLIIQEYDNVAKRLAAQLLKSLCHDFQSREMVRSYDGIPILLSQLHCDNVHLLLPVVWCLVQLCEDPTASKEIKQMGGIPLLLSLLHDRTFVTERTETSEGAASAGPHGRTVDDVEELMEQQYSLKTACCAALTELVMNDANAYEIAQANGIYSLGLLILPPPKDCGEKERKGIVSLQRSAYRTLRFLFSMERNRKLFKMLFPPHMFEKFISIGHYNRDLKAYIPLVEAINSLPGAKVEEIKNNIKETNHNKTASRSIGEYDVFDLLGKGAFGSVYKVKKRTAGQSFLALKEVNIDNPAFGNNITDQKQSVGELMNEISIIREQMKHPNVVRYHKTFVEHERLYIVMELIEGAPLAEHINSLKEKRENFPEERIWNIFMQMVLALRYLHKEKGILHRDLTPNNIMLGDSDDKVTITDFGLAKQKRTDCSKMTSVVGTILYWCPEIVQNEPYGEKADVWALGCILYQMCTLKPPFFSDNMLRLVTKIVGANYDLIPEGQYSDRLIKMISSCICQSSEKRPDIVELAGMMADKLLVHMDSLRTNQISMEKKLEKERLKAQRHYFEANENMQNYHRLFLVSKERYDRLANLAGSGGAAGLKNGEVLDPSLVDIDFSSPAGSMCVPTSIDMDVDRGTGWTSDDESYPSSGSESRESSAGSTRSQSRANLRKALPKPPTTPKQARRDRPSRSSTTTYSPLVLDIPNTPKTSRDSGFSSGDPSPNNSNVHHSVGPLDPITNGPLQALSCRKFSRSNSTPSSCSPARKKKHSKRPNSANTPTLTISQRRVRQISDPILQMLHQLHKIIYISQLPPTLCPDAKRRRIERYKRALFATHSTTFNLKSELKKLMSGSREIIDFNLGPSDSKRTGSAGSTKSLETETGNGNITERLTSNQWEADPKDGGITYEQLQNMIESTLLSCGYYNMSPIAHEKHSPLGPISVDLTNSRKYETPR